MQGVLCVSSTMYSILNKSSCKNIVWECLKCGMPSFSTSLFDTTASLETHNRFDSLSSLSDPESLTQDIIVGHCILVPFIAPPDKIDNEYLEEFNSSLSRIMSNRNAQENSIDAI